MTPFESSLDLFEYENFNYFKDAFTNSFNYS